MRPHFAYVVILPDGMYLGPLLAHVAHPLDARLFSREVVAMRAAIRHRGTHRKMLVLEDRIVEAATFSQESLDRILRELPSTD